MQELRAERRESSEGGRTIIREPDRTIIREGEQTIIRHNEIDRFRYGARDVRMERRGNDNVTDHRASRRRACRHRRRQ